MNTHKLESLSYQPKIKTSIAVSEHIGGDHDFTISLGFNAYSQLARIRNSRFDNDIDALASVVERGLIELEGEIKIE
jgi:hypothetical protein